MFCQMIFQVRQLLPSPLDCRVEMIQLQKRGLCWDIELHYRGRQQDKTKLVLSRPLFHEVSTAHFQLLSGTTR